MKKLKTILSIALICMLTLGGGMLLTGCNKDDGPNNIQDFEVKTYTERTPYENEFYKIEFLGAEYTIEDEKMSINVAITVKKETTFDLEINSDDFRLYCILEGGNFSAGPVNYYPSVKIVGAGTKINAGTETVSICNFECYSVTLSDNDIFDSYELTWKGYSLAQFVPFIQLGD